MNSAHMSALSLTLLIYLILAIAYFGWGKVVCLVLSLEGQKTTAPVISYIWMGWAVTLLVFQLLHFILPLTAFVVAPVFITGVAFALPQMVIVCRRYPKHLSILATLFGIIFVILAVAAASWIAALSMSFPVNYDSGLYHFNTIRWINSFPLIPGLGNLHGRLAFNHSFFVYAAALNFEPFFGHGRSLANSFLFILTIATFIDSLRPIFKRLSLLVESHPFQYASILIAFPALGYLAFSSNGFSSPSPDLASELLQLMMIIVLAQGVGEWKSGENNQNYRVILLGTLAVTAVTIKLSNLAFSAVIMGFVLLCVWKHHTAYKVYRIIAFFAMIILVWFMRGIVLSGVPLYPSTIGYIPAEWAVPKERIINEANWVFSWARHPHTHWSNVIGNWDWFYPWLFRISQNIMKVVFPLTVSLFFFIITVAIGLFKKRIKTKYLEWSILLPSIIGLFYWFFSAPDPRFAHSLFHIILLCSAILFLSTIQNIINRRIYSGIICVVFLIANFHYTSYIIEHRWLIKRVSFSEWQPVKEVPLVEKVTSSGLVVYTPKTGDQCWDSPLPSTPYFNARLRLRNQSNMRSGFTVAE